MLAQHPEKPIKICATMYSPSECAHQSTMKPVELHLNHCLNIPHLHNHAVDHSTSTTANENQNQISWSRIQFLLKDQKSKSNAMHQLQP